MYAHSESIRYVSGRSMNGRQRTLVWVFIAAVHVAAFGGLLVGKRQGETLVAPEPMMVSFITEQPQPVTEPPPPEPPPPPKPLPRMVATPKPTPSPIKAPPIEEEPVDEQPLADPTPPAPAPAPPAPAAEPAIVPPNFVAAYLNNPGPQYPYTSKQRREEGQVWLKVLVSAEGRAEQVLVDRSSGYSRLDDAAVDVVKKHWRFVAAKHGDKAIAAWVIVPMIFELKK